MAKAYESWASSPATRATMQANRSRDTTPELAVRRLLHASGLRYRVAARVEPDIRRTADVAFTRQRIAVLIDGCFWHGCPEHWHEPKTNVDYWRAKIERNVARDRDTDMRLAERGWRVLRFWEHEVRRDAAGVASAVEQAVRERVKA